MSELERLAKTLGRELYQPIEHPLFDAATVTQPSLERLGMILTALGGHPPGTLLDLGCHTGWFSRTFSELGWDVTGLDASVDWLHAAQVLNQLCRLGRGPRYARVDLRETALPRVDVVLCLSVAMYLFRPDAEVGWRTMRRISTAAPLAFIDFGGMYADALPFTADNVIDQVVDQTAFRAGTLLGWTAMGRPLLMFAQ